jgi:hypothetical protein
MFEVIKVYKNTDDIFTVEVERDNLSCSVDVIISENTKSLEGNWSNNVDVSNLTEEDLCDALGSAACYLETNYYIYCDEEFNWHYTTREM